MASPRAFRIPAQPSSAQNKASRSFLSKTVRKPNE
jgi:hypothetical protein